jgi:Fic family protein
MLSMAATFKHFDLRLIEPSFASSLTDLVIELDYLRKKELEGTTPYLVFFQLKELFHMLESLCSARIEGNRTTLSEIIEKRLEGTSSSDETIREIANMEEAMNFIDKNVKLLPLDRAFIGELHRLTVKDLTPAPNGEGDKTPGVYRQKNVSIAGSNHKPPEYLQVNDYMDELIGLLNQQTSPKYDLIKTAIAHHRFVWIHPFTNGNGRVVRLFTYALLVKQGFHVDTGRILNPTAVFCNDRNMYYQHLSEADSGDDKDIIVWCEYVLAGLKREIEKIDRLTQYKFLKKEIIIPAIGYAHEREVITDMEAKILRRTAEQGLMQASDIRDFFPGKSPAEISRQIARLKSRKMLQPEKEGSRKYLIRFDNNYLLRGIIKSLDEKGFLPIKD